MIWKGVLHSSVMRGKQQQEIRLENKSLKSFNSKIPAGFDHCRPTVRGLTWRHHIYNFLLCSLSLPALSTSRHKTPQWNIFRAMFPSTWFNLCFQKLAWKRLKCASHLSAQRGARVFAVSIQTVCKGTTLTSRVSDSVTSMWYSECTIQTKLLQMSF